MIRALFGGSFDPVHRGHVAIVERILADGLAAVVHVVPAACSPHKGAPHAPAAERLAMVRLAFAEMPGALVEDLEVARGGVSYTVDTLVALATRPRRDHERHVREPVGPGTSDPEASDHWRLVIGSDNLRELGSWRQPTRLLALATLLVVARSGWDGALPALVAGRQVEVLRDFDHPASATAVRHELAAGRVPDAWLSPAVAAHIRTRGLYGVPPLGAPKAAS